MSVEFLTAPAIGARHGFFTRKGGVSTGPYAALNCSLSGLDVRSHVMENRARAARALDAAPERLVGVTQIHGADVVVVDTPWLAGEGPQADALVTSRPGIALGVITADCAPVLFADETAGVVGAAHAGWRGAAAGVLEATLTAMRALGARRITAAIGPCIRQSSYEVGVDLHAEISSRSPENENFFKPSHRNGHWYFDLPGYCAMRLKAANTNTIHMVDADTLADEDRFFSHRRRTLAGGGPIGHQISVIVAG